MVLFAILSRYFLLQIASGSALVCDFGYAPRIWVNSSGIRYSFTFGDVLRIQAWVWLRVYSSALGVWFVRENIANAGMRDSFGMVQLSGKPGERPGERRKYCKVNRKELEARRWESVYFPFS